MSAAAGPALVVGATGFIGRRLVRRLVEAGSRVHCLVFPERGQASRIGELAGAVPVSAAAGDADALARASRAAGAEVVYTLAAAGVAPAARDPAILAAGNADLLVRLIAAAAAAPPRLFLHAGSWSEYADPPDRTPIAEDHALAPRSAYGAAKAAASAAGAAAAAERNVPFAILRLFHVYGPGEASRG